MYSKQNLEFVAEPALQPAEAVVDLVLMAKYQEEMKAVSSDANTNNWNELTLFMCRLRQLLYPMMKITTCNCFPSESLLELGCADPVNFASVQRHLMTPSPLYDFFFANNF